MKTIRTVLWAPGELFRRIGSRPTWKLVFFSVVAGNVLLNWLKSCLRGSSLVIDLGFISGSFVSISVILLALWSMLSLFLYFFSVLINAQKRFRFKIAFSLVSHCGPIFLVEECVNFILLRLGTLKSTSLMLPNRFPVGLDLFLIGKSASISLVVLLHSINPFTVWYFATMALGLTMLGGIGRRKALVEVISAWALGVGFALLLIFVIGGTSIGIQTR